MAIRARQPHWSTWLVLVVAAIAWGWERWNQAQEPKESRPPQAEVASRRAEDGGRSEPTGGYERFEGCTLVRDRLNDGDSFRLRLPDGREETFRLYFVDTPESAFKRYREGESNQQRIQDQAEAFGGISPERAVEVGKEAKAYVLELLAAKPFVVFTRWEDPFKDRRYHAMIQWEGSDPLSWLDERLVSRGLCRIFTKGADLPDGTPRAKHQERLRQLEREAKRRGVGGWKK